MTDEATTTLKNYIRDELDGGSSGEEVSDDDNLLTGGMVDSLGVLKLVSFIESEFGLEIPDEDMTVQNFSSLEDIGKYLEKRKTGGE